MDKHEKGIERIREIIGDKADHMIQMFEAISPDFSNYIVDFGYGDLYAREGLTDRYRELAAVACLIGQGNTGLPLKAHLKGMLNVGWTAKEIMELMIFLVGYNGFPDSVNAMLMFNEIMNETVLS